MKPMSKTLLPLTLAYGLCLAPAALADAAVHGSIRLPADMKETSHPSKAEAARMAGLAKLTSQQAVAAARKIAHGKVDKLVLENEDGFLAYAVFLGGHEVLVDAGNGKILGDERESPRSND